MIEGFKKRWRQPFGYARLLKVGLPLVAGMGSSTLMQFTDRLFLSHYSVDAIAAALPAAMISATTLYTLMGLCGYTAVIIGQYVGSNAIKHVGPTLWQGIWCALAGGVILGSLAFAADAIFDLAGHSKNVRTLEVEYFRALTAGAIFPLLSSSFSGFFSGRGKTKQVMFANIAAAIVNIPLDYLLIFGKLGFAPMGIFGAAIATVAGWATSCLILGCLIFTPENERAYAVWSGFKLLPDILARLLRYGLPNAVNFFMDLSLVSWFLFEVGKLGTTVLAASNIAFSINSLVFMPMIGMSMAVAALSGQAMGAGNPAGVRLLTRNALRITFSFMLPICLVLVLAPGFLMDLFAPGDLTAEEFAPVRSAGIMLLYYVAGYSMVDACNLVFFGSLKGAGDTFGVMLSILGSAIATLLIPMLIIKYFYAPSMHGYWICFSVYVVVLALAAAWRFWQGRWRHIKMIETAKPALDEDSRPEKL